MIMPYREAYENSDFIYVSISIFIFFITISTDRFAKEYQEISN